MKLLLLIVVTGIALTVPVTTAASELLSALPSQSSKSPGVTPSAAPMSEINVPACYIQMSNSTQLIDLTQLCGEQPQDSPILQVTYPEPPTPYDQSAIKDFDDSLYGEGN